MTDADDENGTTDRGEDTRTVVLRSPEQFKALGHPVRHRMVNALRQRPATLRQLAEAMGTSKGTVDYHVRVLREAGLVRPGETRQVRGGTEQYFALTGDSFVFSEESAGGAEFLINAALSEMLPPRPGQPEHTVLRHLWLTESEARALADRIRADVDGPLPTDSSSGEPYGLLVSLFPADIPGLGPDPDA
ncbi:ArsR/SmtB family transcription factor [Kitasatospora camelliae]|uniref:Winged helix-turn-helix domain-containing protein n=1 Tax=Kitasatospora camelliae TaxID=3156397 RepID=A0AAU8K7R2_9ACTN